MKRKIFVVDIDGIACDHAKAVCAWVNNMFGTDATVRDIIDWDHDFGPISFVEAVDQTYTDDQFVLEMEVTTGFREFLVKLSTLMNVKFATSRKQYSHNATRRWINDNFGDFEVNFVKRKTDIAFHYLLDDSYKEVISAANAGRVSFLLSKPWNDNDEILRSIESTRNAHFIESLEAIFHILNGENNGAAPVFNV